MCNLYKYIKVTPQFCQPSNSNKILCDHLKFLMRSYNYQNRRNVTLSSIALSVLLNQVYLNVDICIFSRNSTWRIWRKQKMKSLFEVIYLCVRVYKVRCIPMCWAWFVGNDLLVLILSLLFYVSLSLYTLFPSFSVRLSLD